jgi:isopentenyl diphosphate isomerase/L-lactate dehydrogenase-like FMN-dependent dehydrogenase
MTVMRTLLLLAVIALGADALLFSGAYTQAVWREGSAQVEKLIGNAQETAKDARQPG